MTKIFVSQPMFGRTEEEINATYEEYFERAKKRYGDIMLIDSYVQENAPDGVDEPLWFLAKSIELMAKADVVYFAKGWEKSRGCRIENSCAIDYGLEVVEDYTK